MYKYIKNFFDDIGKFFDTNFFNTKFITTYVDVTQGLYAAYFILLFQDIISIILSNGKFNLMFLAGNFIFLLFYTIGFGMWFWIYILKAKKVNTTQKINKIYLFTTQLFPLVFYYVQLNLHLNTENVDTGYQVLEIACIIHFIFIVISYMVSTIFWAKELRAISLEDKKLDSKDNQEIREEETIEFHIQRK